MQCEMVHKSSNICFLLHSSRDSPTTETIHTPEAAWHRETEPDVKNVISETSVANPYCK